MFAIGQIRSRPVHAAVFGGDSAAWAAGQAIKMEALRQIGEAGVRPLVAPAVADGSLSERDVEDLVDWILRILISYAAVPGDGGRRPGRDPAPADRPGSSPPSGFGSGRTGAGSDPSLPAPS